STQSSYHSSLTPCNPLLLFSPIPPPPRSTLFPYTTLFRSRDHAGLIVHDDDAGRPEARARMIQRFEIHRRVQLIGRQHGEGRPRSEEHTSELQSRSDLVCRLLLEKKNKNMKKPQDKNPTCL